jgi:hypothetical protein
MDLSRLCDQRKSPLMGFMFQVFDCPLASLSCQVTVDIALRWSAEIWTLHDSIDIALLWSARGGKSLPSNTFTNGSKRSYALNLHSIKKIGYQSRKSHERKSCSWPPMDKTCITRMMLSGGFKTAKKSSVFDCPNLPYCTICVTC